MEKSSWDSSVSYCVSLWGGAELIKFLFPSLLHSESCVCVCSLQWCALITSIGLDFYKFSLICEYFPKSEISRFSPVMAGSCWGRFAHSADSANQTKDLSVTRWTGRRDFSPVLWFMLIDHTLCPQRCSCLCLFKKKGQKVDSHYHDVDVTPFSLYYTVCWLHLRWLFMSSIFFSILFFIKIPIIWIYFIYVTVISVGISERRRDHKHMGSICCVQTERTIFR